MTAILPWSLRAAERSPETEGALIVIRYRSTPFTEPQRALLESVCGVFSTLVRLHDATLRAEEQQVRFNAMVQTLPHGLVFTDDSGAGAWVNAAAAELLGISAGSVQPHHVSEAMLALRAHADNHEIITRRLHGVFADPKAELLDDRWIFRGPPRLALSISTTPTWARRGPGRLWVLRDVTADHFAQIELEEQNCALEIARQQADAANRAKSIFLACMSHEIRTPMNAVLGMAGLLAGTPLSAEQQNHVEVIRRSGNALLRLINDILDLSKVEAGQLQLDVQVFDLRLCVQDALDILSHQAQEKGLRLFAKFDAELPRLLHVDSARLLQILINLIGNAIKFTHHGEVAVVVGIRPERQTSAAQSEQEPLRLRIEVRDTGIGIPADRIERLFQLFSQGDASMTRQYGGTGLGLAISKRLAELMGGRLWVESEVGVGSSFFVEIPTAAAATSAGFSLPGLADANNQEIATKPPSAALSRWSRPMVLDEAAWQRLIDLAAGDRALLREFLDDYLANSTLLLTQLQEGLAQRDFVAAEQAAQLLHGAAARFGSKELARLCQQMVQAAQGQSMDSLETQFAELTAYYLRVRRELEQTKESP